MTEDSVTFRYITVTVSVGVTPGLSVSGHGQWYGTAHQFLHFPSASSQFTYFNKPVIGG